MGHAEIIALAVLRVHAVLRWAGRVIDKSEDTKLYPRFPSGNMDEQYKTCRNPLSFIQKIRHDHRFLDPDSPAGAKAEACVTEWRKQENAVDFSKVDLKAKEIDLSQGSSATGQEQTAVEQEEVQPGRRRKRLRAHGLSGSKKDSIQKRRRITQSSDGEHGDGSEEDEGGVSGRITVRGLGKGKKIGARKTRYVLQ
jgi:hypothetical protein